MTCMSQHYHGKYLIQCQNVAELKTDASGNRIAIKANQILFFLDSQDIGGNLQLGADESLPQLEYAQLLCSVTFEPGRLHQSGRTAYTRAAQHAGIVSKSPQCHAARAQSAFAGEWLSTEGQEL